MTTAIFGCSKTKDANESSEQDDEETPKKKKKKKPTDDDETPKKKAVDEDPPTKKGGDSVKGPMGLPLPRGATGGGGAPGGGGKIVVFEVPRARETVEDELRAGFKDGGWAIESEEKSPRGTARWVVSNDTTKIKLSVTGDGSRTALILSLP